MRKWIQTALKIWLGMRYWNSSTTSSKNSMSLWRIGTWNGRKNGSERNELKAVCCVKNLIDSKTFNTRKKRSLWIYWTKKWEFQSHGKDSIIDTIHRRYCSALSWLLLEMHHFKFLKLFRKSKKLFLKKFQNTFIMICLMTQRS